MRPGLAAFFPGFENKFFCQFPAPTRDNQNQALDFFIYLFRLFNNSHKQKNEQLPDKWLAPRDGYGL
jgi:hypothetical protein